ncbi:hypothetical protein GBM03_21685 [Yersinia pseudotuberculosis]|nr:hypothetical protein [Yersinia pseudotuberculosis]MBO1563898.1 hypothetical protein [Yersinia pseudotuberculosis]MBO1572627.1 hypothetical protein [Yersinia pseudotuberculosis]MBO1587514.1 hypothetical protein [Yersinia pseudotuberculosis]MBO1637055.1 hypothetical protein [Yersinia pseudotuberculosis]
MSKTVRFRTPTYKYVRKLVKFVSDMHYNSYIHSVQKFSLCHEFLPTVGSPLWNRLLKTSAGKLRLPVLP